MNCRWCKHIRKTSDGEHYCQKKVDDTYTPDGSIPASAYVELIDDCSADWINENDL